mgnify:CR=1 FL=1
MKLVLLELNEINFDAVRFYIERGEYLPGFEKLFEKGITNTESEPEYENLEPWVQWPSVHTGKTYEEHKVFRLGDFVNSTDEQFFEQVEKARGEISLTYFEFSTLAILKMMADANLDVAILEVGLGGRLDAVNLVDADCAIITSIDLDHTSLLGNDRETIGLEKAGIMRSGKSVVLSDPVPPNSIIQHAKKLGADLWLMGQDFNFSGDPLQWSWAGRGRRYSGLAYPALRGANQLLNASGVLAALEIMRPQLPVTAQAIRNGLAMVELTGRFQIVPGEPVLVLDVAHNPHSVAALAANLDAMGFYPCTHAVFGAMADKDLPSMLKKVLPMVDAWYFTDLPLPRASTAVQLEDQWRQMNTRSDVKASQHASPQKALDAAISAAGPTDRILVFGSFYTVGGVLQNGIPKLHAKHLSN